MDGVDGVDGVADTTARHAHLPRRTLLQNLLDDRVLLSAVGVCVLLFGYQLSVTLLQPPWIKPITDWLRAALAWPQWLVMVWVAVRLWRTDRLGTSTVSWAALGVLSYAVGRTLLTIDDVMVYPHGVPFPSLPDLFFLLQYPCFFLALVLLPERGGWLPGVRVLLDGLLWMSAITALTWYFVLLPISRHSGGPLLSKDVSLFYLYQVGDLVIFYGLVMTLVRPGRTGGEPLVLFLVGLAVASLFVGDTLASLRLLQPPYIYQAGSVPGLFRFLCYLFLPLAALVRLRFIPVELPLLPRAGEDRLTWRDMLAGITFVSPSFAVVAASALIIVHATATSRSKGDFMLPEVVGVALLLLAALRPAAMYLEHKQLCRERDAARAQERALRIVNARMETFLSMVAHELKTPLTSLTGNVQLIGRRLEALLRLVRDREDYTDAARVLRALIVWCDQSLERMTRLVDDVLDETRVRQGRFALRMEPCDLVSVVSEAVAEQVALNPERSIGWVAEASSVTVRADASRIEQVVTNLVGNALKFSLADQAIEVRVRTEDGKARVSVHDDGVSIPMADQPYIWERFYQAAGVDVKSGSQVGFGIGLYISKAVVEGHHGQVGVESAPGQGTTIWFTLPLAIAPASSEAAPPAAMSPEAETDSPAGPSQPSEHEHGREREQRND